MDYVDILTNKTGIMFVLIIFGFILKKIGFLSDNLQKEMTVLMLKIFSSVAGFSSFVQAYSATKAKGVLFSIGLSIIIITIAIVVANIFFHKEEYCTENLSVVCGNTGFFGLPVVMATLGENAGMYSSVVNALSGVVMWTYGEYIMSRDPSTIKLKNALKTPCMVFFILGMIFFFLQIPLPQIVKDAISSMGSVSMPMCALFIGASLVTTDFKEIKNDFSNVISIFVKLILVPVITIFLLKFVSNDYYEMKLALIITFSVPGAGSASSFALRHHRDVDKAARLTCACTILSIFTMPLMTNLAMRIWGL